MPSQRIDGRAEYTERDTILFLFFNDNAIVVRRTCTPRRAFHHAIISVILDNNLVHYQSGPSCFVENSTFELHIHACKHSSSMFVTLQNCKPNLLIALPSYYAHHHQSTTIPPVQASPHPSNHLVTSALIQHPLQLRYPCSKPQRIICRRTYLPPLSTPLSISPIKSSAIYPTSARKSLPKVKVFQSTYVRNLSGRPQPSNAWSV